MFKLIFFVFIVLIFVVLLKNKTKIKFKTFLKKGYRIKNTPFGIYCYHNKQGSGKTQSAVQFLLENKDKRIYANMKSIKDLHYKYFSGFDTLLKIGMNESNCIIFYDELFKGLVKGSKMTKQEKENLMDFMSQMRKREIIFITTAQEWLEIPIEFRRYVRYDIKCNLKSFLGIPILVKEFNNTELIKWSQEDNEYISPRISTIIEHGRKKIVNSYDTFEVISNLNFEPIDIYNDYYESNYSIKNNDIENSIEIVEDSPLIEENQDNEIDQKLSNYSTTTYSNSIVNSQFTNNLQNNNNLNNNDTSANFNNIDNDFWENVNDTDFEDNVN